MAHLNQEQLRRLARLGAVARLEELRREAAAIRREFLELPRRGHRSDGGAATLARAAKAPAGRARLRRRRISAEARKVASERMRKYWAERREEKADE